MTTNVGKLASATCTQLACGEDCIVAVGLCGRLRAWRRASPLAAPPGDGGVSLMLSPASATSVVLTLSAPPPAADTGGWKLVLDESSRYALANNRFSSHAYRFLSDISADGRFAVGTTEATGQVQIWCTRTWKRLQSIDPAQSEAGLAAREARGCTTIRASHACLEQDDHRRARSSVCSASRARGALTASRVRACDTRAQ